MTDFPVNEDGQPKYPELQEMTETRVAKLRKKVGAIIDFTTDHVRAETNISFFHIKKAGFLQECPPQLKRKVIESAFEL